jgi:hypothetical protein
MTSRIFCSLAAVAAVLLMSGPAWSHHSHSNYDQTKVVNMDGTVVNVSWMNPHVWVYIEVMDDQGQPERWVLEGGGIIPLVQKGWTRDSLKAGDEISVKCSRLRDGSNGCLLGFVTTADGTEREFD